MTVLIKSWAQMVDEYGIDSKQHIPMRGENYDDGYTAEMETLMPENRVIFCWLKESTNKLVSLLSDKNTEGRRFSIYPQMIETTLVQ